MKINSTPIQHLFIPTLGRASKCIHMLMDSRLNKMDLTLKQFILLVHVNEEKQAQSDLVIITQRDKGSLTRLIQSMERKGFVKRSGSKSDKRINIVESTPAGRKVMKKAEKIVMKTFEELKIGISAREEKAMLKVASKLMENTMRLIEMPKKK